MSTSSLVALPFGNQRPARTSLCPNSSKRWMWSRPSPNNPPCEPFGRNVCSQPEQPVWQVTYKPRSKARSGGVPGGNSVRNSEPQFLSPTTVLLNAYPRKGNWNTNCFLVVTVQDLWQPKRTGFGDLCEVPLHLISWSFHFVQYFVVRMLRLTCLLPPSVQKMFH